MFGNLGQLAGLVKSAQELQANMAKFQQDLSNQRFTADAGGGLVRATVDGRGTLVDVKLDPHAVGDVELLQDLITAAARAASTKAQESFRTQLAALTGGMNLPGLAEVLGGR
jgi:hypothetical protein